MLTKLLEQHHRQKAWPRPAAGNHMERRWRLVDLLAIAASKLLADVLVPFQDFGMTSNVSVMPSPSLDSRAPPQQAHATGPSTITRSRGRCSGNGWRDGRLRVNDATFVVLVAAISAASSSSVAELSNSSSVSSS